MKLAHLVASGRDLLRHLFTSFRMVVESVLSSKCKGVIDFTLESETVYDLINFQSGVIHGETCSFGGDRETNFATGTPTS